MENDWYSVRMRASRAGRHLSGAERIGRAQDLPALTSLLTTRAMTHNGGSPDDVCCTLERLDADAIGHSTLPEIQTWQVADWQVGRLLASDLLQRVGVDAVAVARSLKSLSEGPAPGGGSMRGAMIVDVQTGQRLEPDHERGVRVSHMDMSPDERPVLEQKLKQAGLGHYRVLEALILSAKVLMAPGIVAEICWSDDPDYVTGYVATPACGYQRISSLKEAGDPHGGRVFLVDGQSWQREQFVDFVEKKPIQFYGSPIIHPVRSWSS